MACNSTFECAYCGNTTIGPLNGYTLTPCFEATIILMFRLFAIFFVCIALKATVSLPSLHFLRSRVAFESSRRRRQSNYGPNGKGGAMSSIASGSIASALLASSDSGGAFKLQQPLLDDVSGGEPRHRRRPTKIHQEAALARFPGVPAPRPGPLRRGDAQYLQEIRQSLQADKRDNEGGCPRVTASVLLLSMLVLSIVLLLGDTSHVFVPTINTPSLGMLPPHVASSMIQCIVWSCSLLLIFLEWKKGVHTSGLLRAVWVCMWLGMLVTTYDDVASRLETPSNATTTTPDGHSLPFSPPTSYDGNTARSITTRDIYVWIQTLLSFCLVGVALEIHRRHTKSDLYILESEATVLMQLQNNPDMKIFRRLLLLASVDLSLLLIGFLGAMIASGSNIGFQVMFGTIIQDIILEPQELDSDTGIQMTFCVGMFLGNLLQMGFIEMAGTRLVTRVRYEKMKKCDKLMVAHLLVVVIGSYYFFLFRS